MLPGEVTRLVARFDREGRYVWHCHILSHEDHEMMRPFEVLPRKIVQFAEPTSVPANFYLFARGSELQLGLARPAAVDVHVYNVLGQLVLPTSAARRSPPAATA